MNLCQAPRQSDSNLHDIWNFIAIVQVQLQFSSNSGKTCLGPVPNG